MAERSVIVHEAEDVAELVGDGLVEHLLDIERMVAEADEGTQGQDFGFFFLAL